MNDTQLEAELLAHHAFLRRLAKSLVGAEGADDAVQDTYLAVLERPPRGVSSVRAWLSGVLRHRVARDRRAAAARRTREQRAARTEAVEQEAADALDFGCEVVGAVRGLGEPYRAAIVLRYQRGLSPARMARELGVPLATVNSRLARARVLLRERLDRRHGRGAWTRSMVLLAREPVGLSAALLPLMFLAVTAVSIGMAVGWEGSLPAPKTPRLPAGGVAVVEPLQLVADRGELRREVSASTEEELGLQGSDTTGVIGGVVSRAPGRPMRAVVEVVRSEAGVTPSTAEGRVSPSFQALTDERGRFRVTGLEPGAAYEIDVIPIVEAGPWAQSRGQARPLRWVVPRRFEREVIASDEAIDLLVPLRTLTFDVRLDERPVSYRVSDPGRPGAAWRSCSLDGDRAWSRGQWVGRMSFGPGEGLRLGADTAGPLELTVESAGCKPVEVVVGVGEGDQAVRVDLERLAPPSTLELALPSLLEGQRLKLTLTDTVRGLHRLELRRTLRVTRGLVRIDGLVPGSYLVELEPLPEDDRPRSQRVPELRVLELRSDEVSRLEVEFAEDRSSMLGF
jgi:RNA polymerase sigma factor (sigma-70 family)